MLKIILPLTTRDQNTDRKDIEPLALLVHPQQPLSYLERLIQSELPPIVTDGKEKTPRVWFRAEDSSQDAKDAGQRMDAIVEEDADENVPTQEKAESMKTGKIENGKIETNISQRKTREVAERLRGGPGEGGIESYSGKGHDAADDKIEERKFVRWSQSTEIGDFIRDAARGQEFLVEIENAPREIRIGVPSFADRTYYLRMRLRKLSGRIASMADVKKECDQAAHKAAQRVATAGFAALGCWWAGVYWLTFKTELGWDVMEPVTVSGNRKVVLE